MEENPGLRKGTWTEEEDNLLRTCIQEYGEGKWHLVPRLAGLKRCRKSCRMRWLNYLKPDINRGNFTEDEVDMIGRFHKLLGNRWSVIAARLPGRTANDVKNFWYTNMRPEKEDNHNKIIAKDQVKPEETAKVKPHVVIKPQPHTFSKNSPWLRNKFLSANESGNASTSTATTATPALEAANEDAMKQGIATQLGLASIPDTDQSDEWWENLLNIEVDDQWLEGSSMKDFLEQDSLKMEGFSGEGQGCLSDSSWNDNLWDNPPASGV